VSIFSRGKNKNEQASLKPNQDGKARERNLRIEQAFLKIEEATKKIVRLEIGRGFKISLQKTCYRKWPELSLRLIDQSNPTTDTPYLLFRADDSAENALLQVISHGKQEERSLLDEMFFSQIEKETEHWLELFVVEARSAVVNLNKENQERAERVHKDLVVEIEVRGGLELGGEESEKVRRILKGILGESGDSSSAIVIDGDFDLSKEEAEKVRKERAERKLESGGTTRIVVSSKHTVIANRYYLEQLLGTGGMGAVFLASDRQANKKVAIKVLHPTLVEDPVVLQRFDREVQLIKKVVHPNVIAVFDSGAYEKVSYYTMEYVDGMPMHKLLQGRRMKSEVVCVFASQLAHGLSAIHAAGIIHRDLKAENIVITNKKQLKIIDFGIARAENSNLTAIGEVVGSPAYIAPELWQGSVPSFSSDLYALGVVFYRMICGVLPFTGSSPIAVMNQHISSVPSFPTEVAEKFPKPLLALVLTLLSKDPRKRGDLENVLEKVSL
jgi:predicted Ser/Thr protein kinase